MAKPRPVLPTLTTDTEAPGPLAPWREAAPAPWTVDEDGIAHTFALGSLRGQYLSFGRTPDEARSNAAAFAQAIHDQGFTVVPLAQLVYCVEITAPEGRPFAEACLAVTGLDPRRMRNRGEAMQHVGNGAERAVMNDSAVEYASIAISARRALTLGRDPVTFVLDAIRRAKHAEVDAQLPRQAGW